MKYRSSPRGVRLDDVFRCAKRHRSVAIATADMHAPEKTRGIGKVVLLVDRQRSSYCRLPRTAIARSHGGDPSRSDNSTTARYAAWYAERPEAARPIRPSYALRTRPRGTGESEAANVNSVPHGSRSRRRQPRLPAHRRAHLSGLMVNRGSTASAGSVPRVFAGIHGMMLLLGGTGLGRGGFFRLLLCVTFG
jgi:hypothetical protein